MSGKLKAIKTRIKAVKETQQITKAMKMVSAAKLRRAQDAIVQIRPYSDKLNEMLGNIVVSLEGEFDLALAKEREVNNVLVVLVTSDRGLCGSFNSSLIKKVKSLMSDKYASQASADNVTLLSIGKKGYESFAKKHDNINSDYVDLFSELSFSNSSDLANYIMNSFTEGKYDVIELVYSKFKNAAIQIIDSEQFLPLDKDSLVSDDASAENNDFIYEPSKEDILEELIPKILKTYLHRALLDNNASEHGARMTAMDKATENCDELLGDLRISFNRARQEAITKELSEIVGGAAALEG
jgi:F-type H+-transporting ATPase subunit gamma